MICPVCGALERQDFFRIYRKSGPGGVRGRTVFVQHNNYAASNNVRTRCTHENEQPTRHSYGDRQHTAEWMQCTPLPYSPRLGLQWISLQRRLHAIASFFCKRQQTPPRRGKVWLLLRLLQQPCMTTYALLVVGISL